MTAEPVPPPDPSGTPAWPSPARRLRLIDEIAHEDEPRRDMSRYSQLINDGIASADLRYGAVDHVTARRMALTLFSQSKDPQLSGGLAQFATDGAITHGFMQSVHHYARRDGHPHQDQCWRLLQYTAARGPDLGPISPNFRAECDQADQDDAVYAASPPGQATGNTAKAIEDNPLRRAPRNSYPAYIIEIGPSGLRVPRPYIREEWADMEAENLASWDSWEEHQWELDHEIE